MKLMIMRKLDGGLKKEKDREFPEVLLYIIHCTSKDVLLIALDKINNNNNKNNICLT